MTDSLSEMRKLYLDLVQKCIINTIYEDPNQSFWSPKVFDGKLRELGRDWPSQAHSMIGNQRMSNLRQIMEHVIVNNIPGDFIETGVWRGGACIMARAIMKAYAVTDRRVWVADSFCGLPTPNPKYQADVNDNHHSYAELAVSLEEVKANFSKYDLLDDQVVFLKGWFSETLPGADIRSLAVLRLDGDMYESTMDGLTNLYHKVSDGGFVIVDDFGAVKGCQQAVNDFRKERGIEDPIQNIDGLGVFWCKSGVKRPDVASASGLAGDRHAPANSEKFAVTVVSPPGYMHARAFTEIAETIHYGLLSLGHDSILTTRLSEPGRRSIVLGAHLLNDGAASQPETGSIIYNLEQIDRESNWVNTAYLELLKRHKVWDYSQRNIAQLAQWGVEDIDYVPVGWMPQLTRIAPAVRDIDVLFYGSVNERRSRILNELKARNVRVEQVFGVYGKERDALIARSKIVLNLHFYESKIFEVARVSYLLANGVCVVSESGLDPAESQFSGALAFAPYGELVNTCLRLLSDDESRAAIAVRGKRLMQSCREDDILRQVLPLIGKSNSKSKAQKAAVGCDKPEVDKPASRDEINDAIRRLDAAIAVDETAELWNDWATLQCACGEIDQAERGYRRALELLDSCRQAAVNLGILLFARGRLEEGIPLLERHQSSLTKEEKQNHSRSGSSLPAAA